MKKRIFALMLSLIMVFSIVCPSVVYAEGEDESNANIVERIDNYVRVTEIQDVTDGTYVMTGARPGYNLNQAILSNTSYSSAVEVSDNENIISTIDESYLWTITAVEEGYTIQNSENQYLYINLQDSAAENAVDVRQDTYTMTIAEATDDTSNTGVAEGSFNIGGRAVSENNNVGYLNHRSDAGICTWSSRDIGSCIYLYKSEVKYKVTDTAIAEATDGVQGKVYYTADSYEAYKSALSNAKKNYDTEAEATAAYNALVTAAEALVDSDLEAVTFNSSNGNINWERTKDTSINYVSDISYLNTEDDTIEGVDYAQYTALNWKWNSLTKLINDEDEKVSNVWSIQNDGMSACKYSENSAQRWDYENFYKISGTFTWPEDYDLNDTTISIASVNDDSYSGIYDYIEDNGLSSYFDGNVIPVNDDVYVVMWVEDGDKTVTTDNIDDYLLFWTGTSGKGIWTQNGNTSADWARTTPATFISAMKQGVRAFRASWPNAVGVVSGLDNSNVVTDSGFSGSDYVGGTGTAIANTSHTDGWYTITDTSAINSVMRNNYNSIQAGAKVHLDLYVANNSGEGMIDELEVTLSKKKVTEADVTVMYYYNDISDDTYLGSSVMTNQTIGSTITLTSGTNASQLDYLKSAATAATKKEMRSGVQMNNLTVQKDSSQNIIRVLYTAGDAKVITLTAATGSVAYTGNPITLNEVTVTETGYESTGTTTNGTYTLPDGNTLKNAISVVTQTDPGIYDNQFKDSSGNTLTYVVENSAGQQITDTYTIITVPGTLTITYNPVDIAYTYDFAVDNVYDSVLNTIEKKADVDLPETDENYADSVEYDSENNCITYTPYTVNTGYTSEMVLTFAGNYQVTKNIKFLPASNVLYEEEFISYDEKEWTQETNGEPGAIVDDNSSSCYGYTEADGYDQISTYSNGTAIFASLNLDDSEDYVETSEAATFSFTGTGFDLISECSDNTGMILAVVRNSNNKVVKSYLVDTYFSEGAKGQDDYQVPVIRNLELEYGTYTVSVWACTTDTAGAASAYKSEQDVSAASARTLNLDKETDDASEVNTTEIVEEILADAGISDVNAEDVEVSFEDENSVLNGGSGPEVAEESSENTNENSNGNSILNKIRGFLGTSTMSIDPSDDETLDSTISVYLDGFRVYQPLGTDETAIYEEDGEADTKYYSVYDFVQVSVNDLGDWLDKAAVYVEYDGDREVSEIATYKNQGPQNEVYLSQGCAIAFALNGYDEGDVVQIGAKCINENAVLNTIQLSATEMYYDVVPAYDSELEVYVVTIQNEGEGLLALSGLKVSSGITAMANAELADRVTEKLNATEEASFIPAYFTATAAASVKANRSFSITANTSTDDVVSVIISDGTKEYTLSPTNTNAVKNGKSSTYKFSKSFKIREETDFRVYAVNADGLKSNPIELSVKVQ